MLGSNASLRRSARIAATSQKLKRDFKEISSDSPDKIELSNQSNKKQRNSSTINSISAIKGEFPSIVLQDQDGNDVDIKKIAETHSNIVIFAYPRASTPGCTKQVCGFRDIYKKLNEKKVQIYGLSADSCKAQKNFFVKQKLQYPLLSDPNYKLIDFLGARKIPKGVIRSYWIIQNGKIIVSKIKVSPADSFNEVVDHFSDIV